MSRIDGFVIVTGDGKLKRPRGAPPRIYMTMGTATRAARKDGDSVVPMFVDLEVEPMFIRSKTV